MSFSTGKKRPSNPPPVKRLTSQSTQQHLVCTWSAHSPQSGPSPPPFPRNRHTLTATATATGELFLLEVVYAAVQAAIYMCSRISTRDFSATLLQTVGEVPIPRVAHGAALNRHYTFDLWEDNGFW